MRTPAVILLLLVMLAPRLLGAALPHELACAGMKPHGAMPARTMSSAGMHASHEQPALHAHSDMHSHHQMLMADNDSTENIAKPVQDHHQGNNDAGNCQHCGDCDDHCNAVLLTALPRLNLLYSPTPLVALIALQPISRQNDLNRPPRTRLS